MTFFEWKDDYSVGIEGIDSQHKIIIMIMNELFQAIKNKTERIIIDDVINELVKYSIYHFDLEEKMFSKYRYNDKEKHLIEHEHFIEKIESIMMSNKNDDLDVSLDILYYLRNWFQNHIMETDMDYCKYLVFKDVLQEVHQFLEENRNDKSIEK
jgi:hemerythrin